MQCHWPRWRRRRTAMSSRLPAAAAQAGTAAPMAAAAATTPTPPRTPAREAGIPAPTAAAAPTGREGFARVNHCKRVSGEQIGPTPCFRLGHFRGEREDPYRAVGVL